VGAAGTTVAQEESRFLPSVGMTSYVGRDEELQIPRSARDDKALVERFEK
jgi:hypothetical protein